MNIEEKKGPSSAHRVLDVLFSFTKLPQPTIKEIATHVGLPLPTTHRYVALLKDRGLVSEAQNSTYRLTLQVLSLSKSAAEATPLLSVARPHLLNLNSKINETVLLFQPSESRMICVDKVESTHRLRLSLSVGQPVPLLSGASSKLHLGSLPPGEAEAMVSNLLKRENQSWTSADIAEYLTEARAAWKIGWAVSTDEVEDGIRSVVVPLTWDGNLIATLSVPCPSHRVDDQMVQSILKESRRTAGEIVSNLGI